MTATETARALGEKTNSITAYIRKGLIKAEKIPDVRSAVGYVWEVTTPIEEVRALFGTRTRRPRVVKKLSAKMAVFKALPEKKDLFTIDEAAVSAGISNGAVYNFIRETGSTTLRNGRIQYLSRDFVEKLRKRYPAPMPKVESVVTASGAAQAVKAPVLDFSRAHLHSLEANLSAKIVGIELRVAMIGDFLVRFAAASGYEEK